jgi:seryl-tRNA synthetase
MAGLAPAIHVFSRVNQDVDARHKAGHDARQSFCMHDIRFIREHPDAFDRGLARRGLEPQAQRLISIDERRRAIIRVNEDGSARRKIVPKEMAKAKSEGDEAAVQKLMSEAVELKATIARTDEEQKAVEKELRDALAEIPNLPLDDVPDGKDSNDNVEHHHFGAKREYAFAPKQHFDLGEALGQMDFETAAKLSGARFVVLKRGLARLERALGQFMLDVHTSEPHNYTEVAPPLLVRDEVMFGTAQLPKFAEDQFVALSSVAPKKLDAIVSEIRSNLDEQESHASALVKLEFGARNAIKEILREASLDKVATENIEAFLDGLVKEVWESRRELADFRRDEADYFRAFAAGRWLIPTAEVPLTNLVRESIIDEAQLPMRFTACTPCFRAEAGAAGKDTRGMIRQHQFTKVELVSITAPEQSKDEHERMLSCAEEILRRLGLHYRVMTLCAGDMGFASQKTYDIEVWLPGQNMYREISSCSVCGEFQARRMNARYRTKEGRQVRHVHTLNGSGVAVGRALIAVMETYQQEDGSIAVPDALLSYMGGMKTIEKQ